MATKVVLLLILGMIALATAQDDNETTTEMPTDAPTNMAATTMAVTTMAPMDIDNSTGYNATIAMETRNNHFYCLGENSTRTDFRNITYRWGIWIQYPVLSYLDTMRKRHLMYAIAQMTQESFTDICIAEVEQYGVSTYRESVFIKLYIGNGPDTPAGVQEIDSMFAERFNENNLYVDRFLGQLAINVSRTDPSEGPNLNRASVNDSVHPGCDSTNCPEGDPTLLAVVIGTYYGRWYRMVNGEKVEITIDDLEAGVTGYTRRGAFVNNPRPINYGLEAGDIVFAVFGSVLLLILSFGILMGYCIHPFYLS